ncbi:hypothetical protein [Jiulongibacter sp. NS-SX5]|uniref:hypothetical protein n=1 Tax=Jiulongibacter sp. NS-SX5 TaxID=3463854 RepID=UPI004059DDFC
MKYLNPIFLLFLLPLGALAQSTVLEPVGAKSWGMGNALTALPVSESFFFNPAGLAFAEQNLIISSYDSRFNIGGLSTASLAGTWSRASFSIGVGAERFGDQLYNENKAGIALAKSTGRIALGVKASYLGSYAENITSSATILTEFGVMAKLNSKLNLGLHAVNLTGARLNDGENLPTTINLGLAFMPISQVSLSAVGSYIPEQKPSFRVGLQYALKENLFLRSGIDTAIKTNHFGFGYRYEKWQLDYAANTHPTLGLSHHLSLSMFLPKK